MGACRGQQPIPGPEPIPWQKDGDRVPYKHRPKVGCFMDSLVQHSKARWQKSWHPPSDPKKVLLNCNPATPGSKPLGGNMPFGRCSASAPCTG